MMTHYAVLDVPVDSDSDTIRKAYRAALKRYHPDLHEGDPAAEVHSKRIIDAYNVLKDADKRAIYDEELTRRAQQKRRLFLITVLISAGIACGGSFAALWLAQTPPKTVTAALPSPEPADRSDSNAAKTARDARPDAPSVDSPRPPAQSVVASAPEPIATPSRSSNTASERPASLAQHPRHTAQAAPEWVVKGGEAHSSAMAPPPAVEAKELSPANPEPVRFIPAEPASVPEKIASAEPASLAPAPSLEPGLPPSVIAALEPPAPPAAGFGAAPSASPLPAPRQEVAWADIETSRDVEAIWKFIEEAPSAYHAALAARRLESLIETTDDVVGLESLRATADAAIAEQIQRRLDILTGPKDIVTGTITEQPADTVSAQAEPAPDDTAASPAPAQDPSADPAMAPQPKEAEKHIKNGLAALKAGNLDKALAAFDTAIRLDAFSARAFLHRAAAWESKGALDQALADYNAALELDSANVAALQGRGLLWGRRGDFEQALFDTERAVRANFGNAKAYRDRGMIWLEMGRYNRAIADFSRAVSIDPDLASAYVGRGKAFLKKGDTITATVNFDKAARRDASAAKTYRELMKMQKDASIHQEARPPR
jgi:tetratricopeptide (TPR) repeat protein